HLERNADLPQKLSSPGRGGSQNQLSHTVFLSFIPSANSGWTPVSFSVIINQMEVSVKMFLIISNQIIKMCLLLIAGFICFKTGIVDHRGNKTLSNLLLLVINPI